MQYLSQYRVSRALYAFEVFFRFDTALSEEPGINRLMKYKKIFSYPLPLTGILISLLRMSSFTLESSQYFDTKISNFSFELQFLYCIWKFVSLSQVQNSVFHYRYYWGTWEICKIKGNFKEDYLRFMKACLTSPRHFLAGLYTQVAALEWLFSRRKTFPMEFVQNWSYFLFLDLEFSR